MVLGRVDINESRSMQAVLLSLRVAPRELRRQVRQHTKAALEPEFARGMAERATDGRTQQRVLVSTARITVSDQNVRFRSAASKRALRGGLVPDRHGTAFEFGSNRSTKTRYQRRSKKGNVHTVTRNAQMQLPRFRKRGWAFWPTVTDLVPRFAAMWAQTAVRTVHEAIEGKLR